MEEGGGVARAGVCDRAQLTRRDGRRIVESRLRSLSPNGG